VVTGGLTGGATGTGQSSISGTLTNITNVAQTATYTVTPLSGSCPGATFTVVVTVNPKPEIPAQTATICSATAFTTSPVNNIVGVAGAAGNALNFDGSNDIVTITNNSNFQLTTGTIETWVKTSNAGSGYRAIGGKAFGFALYLKDNVLLAYDWAAGGDKTTGINLADNLWHHVALSFNSGVSNSSYIYIDGVLKLTTTYTVSSQADPIRIGDSGYTQAYNGSIDEFRVWNTSRTQAQVQSAMNSELTGSESGLVAYYKFNQGTAGGTNTGVTTLTDTTTNANNGTLTGFTLTGATSNWVTGATLTPTNTIVPTGTTYTWTVVDNTNVTGESNQTTPQSSIGQTLTNTSNIAQNVVYTVTPTSGDAGNCVGAAFTITVTVNPKPYVSAQTTSTCSGTAFPAITPANGTANNHIVPTGTTYAWSEPVVTGGMTGGVAATGQTTINGNLTNPTNIVQTATYTVTPTSGSAGNCVGETFTVTVTVNPKPFVTPRTATICSGGSFATALTDGDPNATTIVPAGTTYTWSAPTVTGGITGGVLGTSQITIFGTLTNPTNLVQTATYTVTPTSGTTGNCVGAPFTVTVTVNPKPVIFNRVATICSATAFTLTPANGNPFATTIVPDSTTYTWTVVDNTNVTGDTSQATAQTNISQTLTNLTNVAQTVVYTVTPVSGAAGNCPGAPFTITVTVNPKPKVANETTSVCSLSTFTVTPGNGNGNIIAAGTTYSWPVPVVTGGMTGGATGTGQGSISGTLSNITNVAQTATYTVTPTSGLCPGATFTVVVTVNPTPVIPAQTATICSSNAFTTSPTNAAPTTIIPTGTTYTWTVATNTNVTGQSNQTSAQSSISQTLTNLTNVAQNVIYTVTPTSGDTGNCVGATFTITVTVNPKPYVSAQTTSTCSETAFPSITPANGTANNHIVPSETKYAWSVPVVTGGMSGGVAATGQTTINGNLTNPTNIVQTATYTVTPTSGSYGNCVGETFTVTVSINPKPFVTPRTETICSGGSFATALTDGAPNATTIIPLNTKYTWLAPTVSGGITGGAAGTSQTTIFGTLTNPTNIPQTATYYVTPTSGTTGNCVGAVFTVTVTVNPKPVIFDRVDTICSATAFTLTPANSNPLATTIVPASTTYTWTVATNANVTGQSNQAAAQTTISQTLTNLTNTVQTVAYTVTPTSGAAGNCPGATFTITVTVNPRPEIPNQTAAICSFDTFSTVLTNGNPNVYTIVPISTTYTWSAPVVTGGVTGGVLGTSQGTVFGTLTNPTNTVQTATYTVTPTSGAAGSCVGSTFTVIVDVNPRPVIFAQTQTICSGTAFTKSPVNSNPSPTTIVPANTTYTWTVATNANVTGQNNQTVGQAIISETLTNITNVVQTVVYTVTPKSGDAGSCIGAAFTVTITVNPTPVIPNQTVVICSNDSFDKVLTNGNPTAATIIPVNTTYTWSAPTVTGGVTGGLAGTSQTSIFGTLSNPTVLVQTATYTVTATSGDAGNCVASTFDVVVTVNPLPVLALGTIRPVNTMDIEFLIPYTTNFTLTNFTLTVNNSSALPSFEAINDSVITASPLAIPLPASNATGSYDFDLIIKDSNTCISLPISVTLQINLVKVLDKNGQRIIVAADATSRHGAKGSGFGRTANGQIISAPNATRIALSEAASITQTAATFTVSIPNVRGGAVTSRGICWSTSINPILANSNAIDAGTSGNYTISISGATGGTKYYVRSFIINNLGTVYSRQVSFTTLPIVPTVTTAAISNKTGISATSGGAVTSNGGAAITAQGVCWSTTATPTIADAKTTNGTVSPFTSSITGLANATTYYVRAYATNSVGTSYGSEISFTTLAVEPTVTTTAISNTTANSATSGGTVTATGGAAITAQGVCWSITTAPTIANSKTTNGTATPFTSSITGLTNATTYYVRAYATNSVGTAYGNEISFTTLAVAPTVTTTAISSIAGTTASSGGTVTNTGGDAITAQGVCWSTTTAPTTANSKTTNGTATPFTSSITGLTSGTTYFVRAYATNSVGTSYGNEISFTTLAAPTVTTTAITSITGTTANSGGTVTATGGAAITAQGVCWSTTTAPTTANSKTTNGTTSPFTSSITGLIEGTTYYVRAYATNSIGTSYGNEISFTTSSSIITTGLKLHYDTSNTSSYPGSGNTITDISGNGNHGTLVNSSSFTSSVAGGVLSFNGTNQYISTSYTPSNTCTVSMWFYNNLNYTDFNRGIFSTYSTGSYNGFYMGTFGSSLNLSRDGNIGYYTSISSTLAINTWYNITVTSGAGTIKVYLNGNLINTLSGSTTHADVLNIGRTRFDSNYWSGYIGNTMVYDSVLSATDVTNNFNAQKTRFGYLSAPTVTTTAISTTTTTTASSGGTVTATGGAAITAQGVCWSTTTAPTTSNSKTIDGTTSPFTSSITGLTGGTTYFVRAYATNSVGTSYGNEISFTTTVNIVTNGLKLYLDSNNSSSYPGSGNTWYDLSGNGNNGTLVNSPTVNGGNMEFNGANYVNIPHSSSIAPSTGLITVTTWFKSSATGYYDIIYNKEDQYELAANSGGNTLSYAFMPSWNWNGSIAYNLNQWYQVTMTYDQSYQRMYVNGYEVYSRAQTGTMGNSVKDLRIGARNAPGVANFFFTGSIPILMIYDRAQTANEVLDNFNAQKARFGY
jgi:hypothetical protein